MKDIVTREKPIKSMCAISVSIYLWHRKSMELYIIKTLIQILVSGGIMGNFTFSSGVDTRIIVLFNNEHLLLL